MATYSNWSSVVWYADHSSDTQSFLSGAVAGDTVTLTVTAVNDRLVEGPESFTALLVNTTSNADVTEGSEERREGKENRSGTATRSDTEKVEEGGGTEAL